MLEGLRAQKGPPFEVIVADDGSGPATRAVIEDAARKGSLSITHVWQEDQGFRAAAARNRAIAASSGSGIWW